MVGKTKAPTKAESARIAKIIVCGCLACRAERVEQLQRTEAHHLLSGGRRRGHGFTVPLCGWHHRGEPPPHWTTLTARAAFGPSLRLESRAFHARYGSDDDLLAEVNAMIRTPEAA